MRTRIVTTTSDGTVVAVDYNSKSTATVHGRVRLHRPDGLTVLATEDGVVRVHGRDAPPGEAVLGAGVGSPAGEAPTAAASTRGGGGGGGGGSAGRPSVTTPEQDTTIGVYLCGLWTGDVTVRGGSAPFVELAGPVGGWGGGG
jgi:hypothetical protein